MIKQIEEQIQAETNGILQAQGRIAAYQIVLNTLREEAAASGQRNPDQPAPAVPSEAARPQLAADCAAEDAATDDVDCD